MAHSPHTKIIYKSEKRRYATLAAPNRQNNSDRSRGFNSKTVDATALEVYCKDK
ncbi:hypothetical protein M634_21415 [Vibrio parahaemolyticus O1:Kuk str. FDA_R31]|nr:hypothetical protein M634_21415 [Vibrio parahaemolyticus O1:Kuk str. FDA_R31]KIT39118.1 hypothetical protein H331_01070 [Vibrio parahaemolyticus 3644]KIT59378.1 hypothetical protein H336_12765 [Vibrio parahaemolyticus EN9701072]